LNPNSDINPYTPPAAEVAKPLMGEEVPMKRPASVKWAMAFGVFAIFAFALINTRFVLDKGWLYWAEAYGSRPMNLVSAVVRIPGFGVMFSAGRRPLAYWAGVAVLGYTSIEYPTHLGNQIAARFEKTDGRELVGITTIGLIFALLLWWLFYRFTFGRPSRVYFRVVKSEPES
jgi:hypothetical protein